METIQELIDFCEAIPEDQWIGGNFEEVNGEIIKRCVAGHINHHLTGSAFPPSDWYLKDELDAANVLLSKLSIVRDEIVSVNNNAYHNYGNIKGEVITYLKSKIA